MRKIWYLIIIGVILYSVWMLVPSVQYYRMTAEARDELTVEEFHVNAAQGKHFDFAHLVFFGDVSRLEDDGVLGCWRAAICLLVRHVM